MPAMRDARYCRCGTRLARDNVASSCAPCERSRSSLHEPPRVPEELWSTEAFRDAFAARHMGQVLTAYRRHPWHGRVVPQARLAEWLQTSQPQISRAENGPSIQDLATLVRWARALGIPQRHLWFSLPAAQASADRPLGWVPARSEKSGWEGDLSAAYVDPAAIHATAQAFRAADRQTGGGHLYRTVQRYVQAEVGPCLTGSASGSDAVAAFSAAASLTEMLGWMAHDCGGDATAAEHFLQALRLARAAEDVVLQANILASMAHLAESLGRGTEAVGRARAGLRLLARSGCHEVTARLHAMEARGLARSGDARACSDALLRAQDALCRPVADVHAWTSPFDEASLAGEAATCTAGMGELSEAARHAAVVLELRDAQRPRSRALGQLTLATVHVARGDIDAAAELGVAVLAGARGVQSARVRSKLADLATTLRAHPRCAGTRQFIAAFQQSELNPLARADNTDSHRDR